MKRVKQTGTRKSRVVSPAAENQPSLILCFTTFAEAASAAELSVEEEKRKEEEGRTKERRKEKERKVSFSSSKVEDKKINSGAVSPVVAPHWQRQLAPQQPQQQHECPLPAPFAPLGMSHQQELNRETVEAANHKNRANNEGRRTVRSKVGRQNNEENNNNNQEGSKLILRIAALLRSISPCLVLEGEGICHQTRIDIVKRHGTEQPTCAHDSG